MKKLLILLSGMFAWALVHSGSAQLLGEKESPAEQRAEITRERSEILKSMFEDKPELEERIKKAPGYATFSAINMNLLVVSTARGTGVVMDQRTGKEIFMKVTSLGGGVGAGIKDLRALLIFNDEETLDRFVATGWQFGAQADASLKSGDSGAEFGESASASVDTEEGTVDAALSSGAGDVTGMDTPIEIYRITEAGISLQATIAGTKFSQMDELNGKPPKPKKERRSIFKKDD